MSKKYRYRPEVAKQDGVKEIDNDQDGRIDALEIDGKQEQFTEEKEYVEGGERPKGYELTDDEVTAESGSTENAVSSAPQAEAGHGAQESSPKAAPAERSPEAAHEESQPLSPPPVTSEGSNDQQHSAEETLRPTEGNHGPNDPMEPQPPRTTEQNTGTPSQGSQSSNPEGGAGVGQTDLTPIQDTATQVQPEPEVKLSEAESFGKSIKQRIDEYARLMGPNVSQTEASLVRNQVDLFYIFQTVLNVSEYDKFEAGIKALYAGFQENYALCFSYDARFRGIMNIPVSKLKEDQIEVLTSLIDLFCRLASAQSLSDLRGTYNFKTLTDNIYDQFVLSRFLSFVKKVIGDE